MQPPTLTGILIVVVFLVFVILWFIDHRDARIERASAAKALAEQGESVADERGAMEARINRRDDEARAERRKLDEESRAERKETQELIRQLTRNTDAVHHAVTGLEKTVDRLLSKD